VPDDEEGRASLRLLVAWILTGVLILTIFINFVYTFLNIASSVLNYLKKKITSLKGSAMKYLEEKK
jgi:hypothetical protein